MIFKRIFGNRERLNTMSTTAKLDEESIKLIKWQLRRFGWRIINPRTLEPARKKELRRGRKLLPSFEKHFVAV